MSAYEYTRLGALLAWVPRLFLVCLFIQERTACASSAMRLSRISGVTYPRGRLSVALLSGAEVPMHDRMDTSYLAEVDVGNQTFQVILDTGSSDLWTVSSSCTEDDCREVSRYEPSSTLVKSEQPFKLDYLSGDVSGEMAYETVRLGQYRIHNQTIALANHTHNLNLASSGYSGIMGLSFPAEASITASSGQTLLSNLLSALDDDDKFFAVRLRGHADASSFTIGALDPTANASLADFAFAPVLPRGGGVYDYWKLPLDALSLDGVPLPFGPSKVPGARSPVAVLDTGTTLIVGPAADVDRLWGAAGAAARKAGGQWLVRCARALVVRVHLGGTEVALDPADVNWAGGARTDGWCLAGIQPNDDVNSGDWLLGDVFLRNVYVVHHTAHPPKLGLLGTTNVTAALAAFRALRGPDASPPVASIRPLAAAITPTDGYRAAPLYGASLVAGFLVGALFMFLGVRARRKRS